MVEFVREASQSIFHQRLSLIENIVVSKDLLLNTDLTETKKSGVQWALLCVSRPFAVLFCRDVFSHVRINHVMENLETYLHANEEYLRDAEVRYITDKIMTPLESRVGVKYSMSFRLVSGLFQDIVRRRDDQRREIRNEQRWWQMTDAERRAVMVVCRCHAGFYSSLPRIFPTEEERAIYRRLRDQFGEAPEPPLRLRNY